MPVSIDLIKCDVLDDTDGICLGFYSCGDMCIDKGIEKGDVINESVEMLFKIVWWMWEKREVSYVFMFLSKNCIIVCPKC